MGDDLFGGSKQKMTVYGETPGRDQFGSDFGKALQGWLGGMTAGGGATALPGMGEAAQLWQNAFPGLGLSGARLREMLSPEWLNQTPEGLAELEQMERAATERNLGTTLGGLKMQYGRHGQTLSSPMVRALADAELGARENLESGQIGRRWGLYQQREAMLPGLVQMGQQMPYQALGGLQQGGGQLLAALLNYLQASKGSPVVTEQSQGGLLPTLLKVGAMAL